MAVNTSFGAFALRTPNPTLGTGRLRVIRIAEVSIDQEVTQETTQTYPQNASGSLQTADVLSTAEEWTITLNTQSIDEADLDLIFGSTATGGTIVVPTYQMVTVPAITPFDVTITGLASDQVISCEVVTSTAPGNKSLTQIAAAGTLAANQYKVAANTISFHSGLAGLTVGVWFNSSQVLAAGSAHGGTLTDIPLGNLELFMRYRSTRFSADKRLWFPNVQKSGGFSFGSGVDSIPMTFRATLPPGWNKVYLSY